VALTAIFLAVVGILFIAYMISKTISHEDAPPVPAIAKTLSNGTHIFKPTTILISLDGFRADFLNRGLTPTLRSFIEQGVSPEYMMPSFPSVTFPNHFTLATGLYPEAHGIVGNTFWDPVVEKEFYYTDPARSMHPEWWNAEPVSHSSRVTSFATR
jgi:predicted AlkP superfamily pyrophosphatase or phosphodiesterase